MKPLCKHQYVFDYFISVIWNTLVRPDGRGKRCLECGAKMDEEVNTDAKN